MTSDAPRAPSDPSTSSSPVVVGVGTASVEPLRELLRAVSRDDFSMVVVFEDGLPEGASEAVAQATSHLRAELLADGTRPLAGRLYIVPPGHTVVVRGERLHLQGAAASAARLPLDAFFRSLAEDRGAEAVGIVLSGAGTDGVLGLDAIKAAGGMALVLGPASADRDALSRGAVERGRADLWGTPAQLGAELMRILAHPYLRSTRAEPAVAEDALADVFALLRATFGHDLSQYKHGTIVRRIERRMALRKVEELEDYVDLLHGSQAELHALYRDLLIGVTSFFRDTEPFDALKETVFPALFQKRRHDAPLRVWVPGCSTGEEAYSIAIALLEFLGDRAPEYRIQIFGTDIDDDAIQRARRGVYPENIALDVSAERLTRFFVKKDGQYQVNRRLRDMLVFATQNVTKDPPYSRLDLVSCRNLLIYLQPALQRKVMRIFHYALHAGGYLLLGTSESVGDSTDLFTLADRRNKIYGKRSALPSTAAFDVQLGGGSGRIVDPAPRPTRDPKPHVTVQQLADRKVLERFGPPGVVVNQNLDVVQFRGRTGPFLDPAPGQATLNVLKLARSEVAIELRGAIQRCQRDGLPAVAPSVTLRNDGAAMVIDIEVTPIDVPDAPGALLVLFVPHAAERELEPDRASHAPDERRVEEVEHELLTTRQYLQTTIEELETANEELQAANEELQSANEELQSTNEELETSKEELQSTNEELTTVNDELQMRMEELSQSNDDLHNVLISINTALVIVGIDLRIRRFTLAAERLLNLVPSDVGRPVAHLRSFANVPDLERLVSTVIEQVTPRVVEAHGADDRWYELRLAPYKTSDHAIKGVIITFLDTGRVPGAGWVENEVDVLAQTVVGELPQPAMLVDPGLRVTWINEAFRRAFQRTERERDIVGRLVPNLGGPWADARLRASLERAALEGTAFQDLRLVDSSDGARALWASGSRVQQASNDSGTIGSPVLVVVSLEKEPSA